MDVFNTLLPMHDAIALVALVDRYPLALRKSARGHSKATARNVDAYNRAMTRPSWNCGGLLHYSDVIMGTMASQITSFAIVYSTVYSGANQRKHQSPASLAFVRGIHRWPVNSLHKGPVTRQMMKSSCWKADTQFWYDDMNNFWATLYQHFNIFMNEHR